MALTRHAGAGIVLFATILFFGLTAVAQGNQSVVAQSEQCQADGQVLDAYSTDELGRLRSDLERIQAQIVCVRDPVKLDISTPTAVGQDLLQVTCANWDQAEELDAIFGLTPSVPQCVRLASNIRQFQRSVEQAHQANTKDDIQGVFSLQGGTILFSGEFFPGRGSLVDQLNVPNRTKLGGQTVEPGQYNVYMLPFRDAQNRVRTDTGVITIANDDGSRVYSFSAQGQTAPKSSRPIVGAAAEDRDGDGASDSVAVSAQLPHIGARWTTVGGFPFGGDDDHNKLTQAAYHDAAESKFDYSMANHDCAWDIDQNPPASLPLRKSPEPLPEFAAKVARERALTHEFLHGIVDAAREEGTDLISQFADVNPVHPATTSWSSLGLSPVERARYQDVAREVMPGLEKSAQDRLREAVAQASADPSITQNGSHRHQLTLLSNRIASGVFTCRDREMSMGNDAIRGACDFANRVHNVGARLATSGGAAPNPDTVREALDLEIIRTKRGLLVATPKYVEDPGTWHTLRAERCAAEYAKQDLVNDLGHPSRWTGDTQAFTSPEEALVVGWDIMLHDPELFDEVYSEAARPEARRFLIDSLMGRVNPGGKGNCTLQQLRDFMRQEIGST